MNTTFQRLLDQATTDALHATQDAHDYLGNPVARQQRELQLEKFAQLIVQECAKLNKHQSYELMGVITDVEEGDGFDDVCLNTVKRVAEHLAKDLKEHFGVEE
jgi:hypothetical protein